MDCFLVYMTARRLCYTRHAYYEYTTLTTPTNQSNRPSRLFLNVKGDVRAAHANEEAAHWLQAMKLYQQEYCKPFQVGPVQNENVYMYIRVVSCGENGACGRSVR